MKRWLNVDRALTAALFFGYLALLLATSASLGFMRDEGFYFQAARVYGDWLELLGRSPAEALSRAVLDRHWSVNHEHPSLLKLLFALSNRLFSGWFSQTSTSFRFPAMVLSSLAVAVTYDWGRRALGRSAGVVAALSFAFLPRVFFHSHLACFDMPVCALWLLTVYVYSRSLTSPSWAWALGAGIAYGLLLDTKHNSWLLPLVLGAHFLVTRSRKIPKAWPCMLLLGPALCFALWPWLWHDTFARLREYALFHTGHEYYNMEFLGRTYWKPPMPRAYAPLMTAATVPAVTLVLAGVGVARWLASERRSDFALWGLCIAVSYAPWLSSGTPIFGGTKHWLTAYPFVCLFAGLGFSRVVAAVRSATPRVAHPALLGACVVAPPLVMALHAHPFGLSAYTPLVGGAPGAASLGLNRTFWGYTTQSLAPLVNSRAPRRGTVYVHDTALASFAMLQRDGRLRRDLRGSLDIALSDVALYHHEPHMSRVEHQIWLTYKTTAPEAIATFDGVPVAWGYARPRAQPPK
ncbi:MAG: glycosyltransferase family 39 protein [Myxococcales bacterium]|nr:MAG: glycosyltransferase family 39 protein [Myxococcales bacterium]